MSSSAPRVVAVGGGHGLAATLRAVRLLTDRVTAVVSVADDGGSSGRLRSLLHIIPPGDLRNCLVALAEPGSALATAFSLRYEQDELAGHSLGNLILAGLFEVCPDPVSALDEAARLLGVRGRVLPSAVEPVTLKAESRSGSVDGQVAVMGTSALRSVSIVPTDPATSTAVAEALSVADLVLLGPGSLFTSVLAAVVVPDVLAAVNSSPGERVYLCNLHPQEPETSGFDVAAHVSALLDHGVNLDRVICDSTQLPVGAVEIPVVDRPLSRANGLAHDPSRLAAALSDLLG